MKEEFEIKDLRCKNSVKETQDELKGIKEVKPNEVYRIVISNGFRKDGKRNRICKTVYGNLEKAIQFRKDIIQQIKNAKIALDGHMAFSEFADYWDKYLQEKIEMDLIDENTVSGYRRNVRRYLKPYFKDKMIINITTRDIERFIFNLTQKQNENIKDKIQYLDKTTIAHAYKILKRMLKFAVLEKLLFENPCDYIHRPPTIKYKKKDYFNLEELNHIKDLLKTENMRFRVAINLIISTGCRRGELLGLKWEDIDFENGKISFNKAITSCAPKSNTNKASSRLKKMKTENSYRMVGITSECIQLLRDYHNSLEHIVFDNFVFMGLKTKNVMNPNGLTKEWLEFRAKHNLKVVTVHGLRHSHATLLLSLKIPEKDIARRMGHSLEMLHRIYAHSSEKEDEFITNQLEMYKI